MEFAPTPFTPEQISDASSARVVRTRTDERGGAPVFRVTRYLDGTAEAAVMETFESDSDGEPLGDPERFTSTWSELRDHAKFPADITTIERDTIDTPLGVVDTMRYSIVAEQRTMVFWFAPSYPGMPIRYQTVVDGVPISTTTVVDSSVAPKA